MMVNGEQTVLANPTGDLEQVDPGDVSGLLSLGYRKVAPDEISRWQAEQARNDELNSPLSYAKTASEGLAEGATLNLSDVAENALLNNQAERMARAEAHPYVHGGAQVAGMLAPVALTGGTGAAAEAAEFAPSALTAGIAPAVSEGIEGLAGGSRIAKLLSGVAGTAAQGGIETGIMSAASDIGDEDQLHPLSADAIAQRAGLSALLGAGIGGGLHLGVSGVAAGLERAQSALDGSWNVFSKPGGLAEKLVGVGAEDPDAAVRAFRDVQAGDVLTPASQNALAEQISDGVEETAKGIKQAIREGGNTFRASQDALNASTNPAAVTGQLRDFVAQIDQKVAAMKAEPALYDPYYTARLGGKLRDHLEGLAGAVADGTLPPAEAMDKLVEFRHLVEEDISFGGPPLAPGAARNSQDVFKRLRSSIADGLHDDTVWGAAGSSKAAFDDAWTNYKRATDRFIGKGNPGLPAGGLGRFDKISQEVIPDAKKIKTWLNQAGDIRGDVRYEAVRDWHESAQRVIDVLDEAGKNLPTSNFDAAGARSLIDRNSQLLEDAQRKASATQNFRSMVPLTGKDLAPGGIGGLAEGAGGLGLLGSAMGVPALGWALAGLQAGKNALSLAGNVPAKVAWLSRIQAAAQKIGKASAFGAKMVTAAEPVIRGAAEEKLMTPMSPEQYTKLAEQIRAASNPQVQQERLGNLEHLSQHAPGVTATAMGTSSAALGVLAATLPPVAPRGLADPEPTPTNQDIQRFQTVYYAVKNPERLLHRVAQGHASPAAIDAVQQAFPATYAEHQKNLLAAVTKAKGEVPPQARNGVERILGMPLRARGDTTAQAQQALYAVASGPPAQPAPSGKPARKIESKAAQRVSLKQDYEK